VSPEEVRRIAALAELAVPQEELPALTAQLDRIVEFVSRLSALPPGSPAVRIGNAETPLREDVVRPARLAAGPASNAPEFAEGFFLVPRLGAMEEP
jgi:aspartyl-tRNA(Asn)/glutamyl-tRNA(Gln) amidotransferase subunit C